MAWKILDSRGNPTLQVSCQLSDGALGQAAVPSGASTGVHEALELRDHDVAHYGGLGVLQAVANVNFEINKSLAGREFDQAMLDKFLVDLDGTENKSRLGANAILGVSLAFARACALSQGIELFKYLGALAGNKDFHLNCRSYQCKLHY